MPIRITGLNSNLDTDSIVKELVSAYSLKKQGYEKKKTTLEWKMDAWKDLNAKIYKLYSTTMSNMTRSSTYNQKATSVSDPTKATVTANNTVGNGTQKVEIKNLASAGYLTGGKIETIDGDPATGGTTLAQLGYTGGDANFSLTTGGTTTNIKVDGTTTINDVVKQLNDAGVNASFDETNQRMFIRAKESGEENDFSLTGADANGMKALSSMGVLVKSAANTELYEKLESYAQYDPVTGAYDAAKTEQYILDVLDAIDDLKTKNTQLEQANTNLQDANTNLQSKRNYAMAAKGIQDTFDKIGTNLTSSEKNDLKGLLVANHVLTDAEIAQRDQLIADSGLTNDEVSALAVNIKTTIDFETEAPTSGNSAFVNDVQSAVAAGDTAFNSFVQTDIDDVIDANNATIVTNKNNIKLNQKAINDNAAVTGESGTNAEQAAAVEQKIKSAIDALGSAYDSLYNTDAKRIDGEDAKFLINDAEFTSSSNTITVNGLTINALQETQPGEPIIVTTNTDVQGIYDNIKNFLKEYNTLMTEMTKLYNADSAKGYEPLTDEERDEMSDTEIEKWETKIKDSLLRRDDSLSSVMNTLTMCMSKSYEINGKTYSLSSFGIKKESYFTAAENEGNNYMISGDSDWASSADSQNKLMAAIQNDPETVEAFFTKLMKETYDTMGKKMKSSELSSIFTVYNDKQMKNELNDYKDSIDKWNEKLEYYEEFYYNKFSAMETALAKLQSSTNSLTALLGG